jgi:hypothetical protein
VKSLPDPAMHDYEASDACTNYVGGPTELPEGDDGCTHNQWRAPHCAWCGNQQDMGWHTPRSR